MVVLVGRGRVCWGCFGRVWIFCENFLVLILWVLWLNFGVVAKIILPVLEIVVYLQRDSLIENVKLITEKQLNYKILITKYDNRNTIKIWLKTGF